MTAELFALFFCLIFFTLIVSILNEYFCQLDLMWV